MDLADNIKYGRKQKRIFTWAIIAVSLFILAWTASIYRHLFGFDPHWAGANFVFNVTFLFPATIISLLISYFTGGLTVVNWRNLPNKKISVITVLLSLSLIVYVFCNVLTVFRQH
jgi:hypothetical protein